MQNPQTHKKCPTNFRLRCRLEAMVILLPGGGSRPHCAQTGLLDCPLCRVKMNLPCRETARSGGLRPHSEAPALKRAPGSAFLSGQRVERTWRDFQGKITVSLECFGPEVLLRSKLFKSDRGKIEKLKHI